MFQQLLLTDGSVKVGGLSLMSATIMVAVPVLDRPFDAPSKSWIFTVTRYLSFV